MLDNILSDKLKTNIHIAIQKYDTPVLMGYVYAFNLFSINNENSGLWIHSDAVSENKMLTV